MFIHEIIRRLRYLLRKERESRELEEELEFHRQMRTAKMRQEGIDAVESVRLARIKLGNKTVLKEKSISMWEWTWIANIGKDVRYTCRSLLRNPIFTIVAILTLALGIGANTAIFSVANVVLLKTLPVRDPQRLFYVHVLPQMPDGVSNTGDGDSSFSYQVFSELRTQNKALTSLLAYVPIGFNKVSVRTGTTPQEASVNMVSGDFFTGLGVSLACGGGFSRADEREGTAVAVLRSGFAASEFGKDCSSLGKQIYIKGLPFTIAGIAPPRFKGMESTPTDVWIPLQRRPEFNAWGSSGTNYRADAKWWCLRMIAGLKSGTSEQRAETIEQSSFLRAAYRTLGGKPKSGEAPRHIDFVPARGISEGQKSFEQPLYILLAMVGVILLIACGNVAMLLVARNSARQREFSIRLSLGGSKARLFQQLLVESLILVSSGAFLGWIFAIGASKLLAKWAELDVSLAPDSSVLAFTIILTLIVGLLFGLAPFSTALAAGAGLPLKQSAATAYQERSKSVRRRLVLVLQVAMGLVLSVSAGLLVQSLRNLENQDVGFQADRLLAFGITPPATIAAQSPSGSFNRFYQPLLDDLRQVPSVESATVVENRPGTSWSNNTSSKVDGQDPRKTAGAQSNMVRWNGVGADYFQAFGIPIRSGRGITASDSAKSPKVAVVNETFVQRFLHKRDALGHQLSFNSKMTYTIVGVARNSKYTEIREKDMPMAYIPAIQVPGVPATNVVLRTKTNPMSLLPEIRKRVAAFSPNSALLQPMTLKAQFTQTITGERLMARLSLCFGVLALLLVSTGLYGTLSYAVNRRTSELGIRMALGAQRRWLLWMILRENLYICLAGLIVGLPLAFYTTRFLASVLFGLAPHDPVTVCIAAVILLCVTVAASILPAYRAASVDPLTALRYE